MPKNLKLPCRFVVELAINWPLPVRLTKYGSSGQSPCGFPTAVIIEGSMPLSVYACVHLLWPDILIWCTQTSEEELFGNISHPEALDEFLDVLGEKVQLKGFDG